MTSCVIRCVPEMPTLPERNENDIHSQNVKYLSAVNPDDYIAIFFVYVGGHGPVIDLSEETLNNVRTGPLARSLSKAY